ncbi:unnamed protein product [Adineta steineri]|nr:unnamed protein product [Adineta steineri]
MSRVKVLMQHKLAPNPNPPRIKPTAIVMGRTGAGKTTLYNLLCGTENDAGAGAGSVTQNLHRNNVNCGDKAFLLIDTPGTNSSSETYKHALLLKSALTATKINTAFIITKYESRFDTMLENCYEVERPIYDYVKNIVVMISHWDHSENQKKDYDTICELFKDYCTNIIFYSKNSWPLEISGFMYNCISNMEPIQIIITDEDFFLKFNVTEIKLKMRDSFNVYDKTADKLFQEYSALAVKAKSMSSDEQDEIFHMLIVEFKNEMEKLLEEFKIKHGAAMQHLDYYTFYIKMQQKNVKICDDFVEQVHPFMSYNLFDNKDPRNLIKKCPNCHLIWYKTEGCDGSTNCGNSQFSNYYDVSKNIFWKYILKRQTNGELAWEKNKIAKTPLNKRVEMNATSKRVGCGQRVTWSELPKLEDHLLLELFKVKTIDEAKQLIREDEEFNKIRKSYEANIDSTFHS